MEVRATQFVIDSVVDEVLSSRGSLVPKGKGIVRLTDGQVIRCPDGGTIRSIDVSKGDKLSRNALIAMLEPCGHLQCFSGVCAICGSAIELSGDHVITSHTTTALTVHRSVAKRVERSARKELLDQRRLVLILDLDETLIQSSMDRTNLSFATHFEDESLRPNRHTDRSVAENSTGEAQSTTPVEGLYQFSLQGPNGLKQIHFVKLRPHVSEFLEALSDKYEMHVYTHGVRNYADKIAAILDPKGTFFQGRVLSRNESGSEKKSIGRLFPHGALWDMVMIVDDNHKNVWQGCPNVIVIDKFQFFAPLGRPQPPHIPYDIENDSPVQVEQLPDAVVPGASVGEAAKEKEGEKSDSAAKQVTRRTWPYNEWMQRDQNLLFVKNILLEVHKEYFLALDAGTAAVKVADVRTITDSMRAAALQGTEIVFTGVLNKNVRAPETFMWKMAKLCGAVCHAEMSNSVTHVVAGRQTATLKVARKQGKHIVTPAWLFIAFHSWARADEEKFAATADNTAAYSDEALMMLEYHARTLFLAYSREHQPEKRTAQERDRNAPMTADSDSDCSRGYASSYDSSESDASDDSDEEFVGEGATKKRKLDILSAELLDGW